MFEKFSKIEERLNSLIQGVLTFIISLIKKIIPQKFINRIASIGSKVNAKLNSILSSVINRVLSLTSAFTKIAVQKMKAISGKTKELKKIPLKEVSREIISPAGAKKGAHFIGDWTKKSFDLLEKKASNFGPSQLIMAFIATIVITIGLISIIDGAKEIAELETPGRIPASIQEYKYSPKYRLFVKRTMKVMNVKIPIYRENVKQVRSVTVDFTVRTTTRFAKKYLEHYETQLKDYFFTHTEPVISSFPIEKEGKEVFKEKIAIDLNNFLKQNKVEGEVEEVGISFIIAN